MGLATSAVDWCRQRLSVDPNPTAFVSEVLVCVQPRARSSRVGERAPSSQGATGAWRGGGACSGGSHGALNPHNSPSGQVAGTLVHSWGN